MAKKGIRVSTRSALLMGALMGHVSPLLAKDTKIDWKPIATALRGKDFATRKAAVVTELRTQTKDKLAKDASIEGVAQLLDMIECNKPEGVDMDPMSMDPVDTGPAGLDAYLKGKLSSDDYAEAMKMMKPGAKDADPECKDDPEKVAKDEDPDDKKDDDDDKKKAEDDPPDFEGKPVKEVSKKAMDAAINSAVQAATKTQRDIRDAERFVRPWVGDLAVAFDSSAEVYKHALGVVGVKVDDVHPSAFRTILELQPKPGTGSRKSSDPVLSMDAAAAKSFSERFPGAARIKSV